LTENPEKIEIWKNVQKIEFSRNLKIIGKESINVILRNPKKSKF